jgi:hypothetical protein
MDCKNGPQNSDSRLTAFPVKPPTCGRLIHGKPHRVCCGPRLAPAFGFEERRVPLNRLPCSPEAAVGFEVILFVLGAPPQVRDKPVCDPTPLSIHTDLDPVAYQHTGKSFTGESSTLTISGAPQRRLQCIQTKYTSSRLPPFEQPYLRQTLGRGAGMQCDKVGLN